MTDTERNLLHAICKTPADDDARMVYADYLDETGGPLRAEFVRLQVAIAREKPVKTITRPILSDGSGDTPVEQLVIDHEYRPEYYDLRVRAADVWRQAASAQEDWFGDPWHGWDLSPEFGAAGRQSGSVTRGFVSEIALAWPDWQEYHADLFWTPEAVCPHCHGTPVKVSRWRIAEMDADDYGTSTTFCSHCKQTGKLPGPNPFRGTEQPLTKVTFTTWSDIDISDVMDAESAVMAGWGVVGDAIKNKLKKLWPGVEFVLPNPHASQPQDFDSDDAHFFGEGDHHDA